ncbi:FscB [Rhodobacter sp. HX-7-19]|uniref:FscB n=1 Tax=Paragemmobacter kunshanensis TaxID=2583234 RepID=A0A6M1TSU2_9RHOB|nr:FscB [Rhodobacter kunshanensis]NGQ93399.1 FscB [Rhodobacter kunshanensis]
MSYILHLGHQPTDVAGISGLLNTTAIGFDANLDVNGIRFIASRSYAMPFSLGFAAPAGDLWLGFRYVPPNGDADLITEANASFIEFFDANQVRVAQIQPVASTDRYHAVARGDTTVQGNSSYTPPNGQPQWIDVRVAVAASITIDFYVDGVLHSSATAANTQGKGKPVQIVFPNVGLHGTSVTRTWYYAHFAVLDGVSTIGRRFVRRTPNAIATFSQMAGSIDALKDEDVGTRLSSNAAGQRLSFSLTGPTGPAAVAAIAGVHVKQVAQAGTVGPQAAAGFLRMGGVNHDAAPVTVPSLAPRSVYSTWALNPADSSAWTSVTLPAEVGILSA